jgi:hypothetical protein
LRVFVDLGRVFNLFGAVRVLKSVERFFVVVDARTDGTDHDSRRVAS